MGRAMTEDRIKALTIEWCPHKSSHSPGVPTLCAWCCTTFALLRTAIAEATAALGVQVLDAQMQLTHARDSVDKLQERLNRTADERDAAIARAEKAEAQANSHEAQLVRISALFGKDARHAEDGTIAGMVEAEFEEAKRLHQEAFRVGMEWQHTAKATQKDANNAEARAEKAEAECERLRVFLCGVVDVRDEYRELLRNLEWSGHPTEWECPECHFARPHAHKPDCRLAAALREAPAKETT